MHIQLSHISDILALLKPDLSAKRVMEHESPWEAPCQFDNLSKRLQVLICRLVRRSVWMCHLCHLTFTSAADCLFDLAENDSRTSNERPAGQAPKANSQ
jgi:hypothetical protein